MQYIFPPRPKSKITPQQLHDEEKRGIWLWQRKFDGDRCVSAVDGRQTFLGNRHGRWHKATRCSEIRRELRSLKLPSGQHYLDGELMPGGILVLFDVLQVSNYLIGVDQLERLSLLDDICGNPTDRCEAGVALRVSDHIWMAEHGFTDFMEEFKRFAPITSEPSTGLMLGEKPSSPDGLIEGLLLRKKQSCLDSWGSSAYDVDWQLRCRHGKKGYRF